jgi:putative acyl-CoA dehydrogenase
MMTNVLADMAVEVEAATLLALRVAKATDHIDTDEQQGSFARVATPVAKFFNCSRAPALAYEALQCHGGNGFIEENPMARLYREAPLNSVWEGTANMMCMDVRRAMLKSARCREALIAEFQDVRGQHAIFDHFVDSLDLLLDRMLEEEFLARWATEAIARAVQGAELLRHSTIEVVDAFMETRLRGLSGNWGVMFGSMGTLITKSQATVIARRAQFAR